MNLYLQTRVRYHPTFAFALQLGLRHKKKHKSQNIVREEKSRKSRKYKSKANYIVHHQHCLQ